METVFLLLLIAASYHFTATATGRGLLKALFARRKSHAREYKQLDRCNDRAASFIHSLRYRQLAAGLWGMAFVAMYPIYNTVAAAYADPRPTSKLLLLICGGLVMYIVMGNLETLREIKDSPWYRTQRMFDDY